MSKLGFSRDFLIWAFNYVMHRKQFVQIDDTCSEVENVNFWSSPRLHFGPGVIQYLCCWSSGERKCQISDLNSCRNTIYQSINKLSVWSKESTLAFNNDKTKVMILSTPQMSRVHHLDEYDPNIAVSGYKLERIKSCKLLGVHINEHLKWDDVIKHMVSGCYVILSILRKLKYLAKYELRKQLAEHWFCQN